MRSAPPLVPRTVDDYVEVLQAFATDQIDAESFERRYFDLFQNDATFHPPEVFAATDDVFHAIDNYYADPALRDPEDLDEDQLRERVRAALITLQQLLSPA